MSLIEKYIPTLAGGTLDTAEGLSRRGFESISTDTASTTPKRCAPSINSTTFHPKSNYGPTLVGSIADSPLLDQSEADCDDSHPSFNTKVFQTKANAFSFKEGDKSTLPKFPFNNSDGPLGDHSARHTVLGKTVSPFKFKQHLKQLFAGLFYTSNQLRPPTQEIINAKIRNLCEKSVSDKRKTLYLDLDETLIHCCTDPKEKPDVFLTVKASKGQKTADMGIKVRPFVQEFLATISQYYEIVVFTAAAEGYARAVVEHIDPAGIYIQDILSREHCLETRNGFFIKDLRIIQNRSLNDVLIVDNMSHSYGFQPENGVPIIDWTCDETDEELLYLSSYLIAAFKAPNLKEFNKNHFKLDKFMQNPPVEAE